MVFRTAARSDRPPTSADVGLTAPSGNREHLESARVQRLKGTVLEQPHPPVETSRATAEWVLANQPFSSLIGAELIEFGEGQACLRVPISSRVQQQDGYVHGGVLAYCVDNAVTFAAGTVLGPSIVTRGIVVEYLRPATGVELIAHASITHVTSRYATCRSDVYVVSKSSSKYLCAVGQGTVHRRAYGG